MKLIWNTENGDASAKGGTEETHVLFEVEQAGEHSFWAFKNGHPVGSYDDMEKAKARCQALQSQIGEEA